MLTRDCVFLQKAVVKYSTGRSPAVVSLLPDFPHTQARGRSVLTDVHMEVALRC